MSNIPFNKPFLAGKELSYIAQAVRLGNIAGDGHFTRRCSRFLEQRFGIHKVLLTPSCTAALELAAMLSGLAPGDEVILPSYTFVSTASAFVRAGAKPVFVDIRPDTLNIDENLIQQAITPRTKVICVVHYAGVACEMEPILALAGRHGLRVVEDAAQAVNAFYYDRPLGSLGQLGTYSFHETKNYICGEGGALAINTPELVERAEILRDKGTNRQQFFRGRVDKYTWVDIGSSYVLSEIASAFLYGQLEMLDQIAQRRRQIHRFYRQHLAPLETEGLLRLPLSSQGCLDNHHMFYILLKNETTRNALLEELAAAGIHAVFHYVPLHSSPMGRKFGYTHGDLPVTERISTQVLRLPFFYEITEEEQQRVVSTIRKFFDRKGPNGCLK